MFRVATAEVLGIASKMLLCSGSLVECSMCSIVDVLLVALLLHLQSRMFGSAH